MATLVGYTSGGQLGWLQDGPFYGYLVADETTLWSDHRLPVDHVALGPLSVQPRGRALRVSISFPVPNDVSPGLYNVTYCNDPCTTGLGDLIGGFLAVGVDAPRQVQREWFLDEPEIANLAADAILTGPGYRVTAGDVRAGRVAEPPASAPGSGRVPATDDRPAPPQAEPQAQVPPVVTTVLPGPVATAEGTDPPGEGREDRPPGTLLVVTISVIAIGAVMGLSDGGAADWRAARYLPALARCRAIQVSRSGFAVVTTSVPALGPDDHRALGGGAAGSEAPGHAAAVPTGTLRHRIVPP